MVKIFNKSIRSSSDFERYYESPSTIKECRKKIGYDPITEWYNRLDAVEKFARKGKVKEKDYNLIVKLLSQIMNKDDDWRIKELCSSMLESLEKHRDFSETEPYKERLAEEERLKIKVSSELFYDPRAIWYNRLDAVKKFSRFHVEEFRKDLELIAAKDDDCRVREVVGNLLNPKENSKKEKIEEEAE